MTFPVSDDIRMAAAGADIDVLRGRRLCSLVEAWCAEFETGPGAEISVDAICSADAVVSDNPAAIRFAGLDYGRNDDELRQARQFLRAAADAEVPIAYSERERQLAE